jgi:hypothetical protein
MFHQDFRTRGRGCGEMHKGDVWKYPQILGIFGKWGTGGRHIYNIKKYKKSNFKNKNNNDNMINLNNNIN